MDKQTRIQLVEAEKRKGEEKGWGEGKAHIQHIYFLDWKSCVVHKFVYFFVSKRRQDPPNILKTNALDRANFVRCKRTTCLLQIAWGVLVNNLNWESDLFEKNIWILWSKRCNLSSGKVESVRNFSRWWNQSRDDFFSHLITGKFVIAVEIVNGNLFFFFSLIGFWIVLFAEISILIKEWHSP